MKTVVLPSPGTTFGRLTVIREARTPNGRQGMLCLCACGRRKIVQVAKLVSGHTKSCGCLHRLPHDLTRRNPGEIPLYGKLAAGRVARIDDGDFELVSQYRWRAYVIRRRNGSIKGPYAITQIQRPDGGRTTIRMHSLITGWPLVESSATVTASTTGGRICGPRRPQRMRATRRKTAMPTASQFKGVHRNRDWVGGSRVSALTGSRFISAHSTARRRLPVRMTPPPVNCSAEFARLNFPDEPAA